MGTPLSTRHAATASPARLPRRPADAAAAAAREMQQELLRMRFKAHESQQEAALLRYQLAVAREEAEALRQHAADAAAEDVERPVEQRGSLGDGQVPLSPGSQEAPELPPAQLRTLHCAVAAHLLHRGCKLAATVLRQEARLPAGGAAAGAGPGQLEAWYLAAQQLEPEVAERLRLQAECARLQAECADLQARLAAAVQQAEEGRGREQAAAAELEYVRGKAAALEQQLAEQAAAQGDGVDGGGRPRDARTAAAALAEVAACLPGLLPATLVRGRAGEH